MFSTTQNLQFSKDGRDVFQHRSAPHTAADNRQLILLVEDNQDSCIMLRTLLEIWGYRVIEAGDGEEAIMLAQRESPSLILMDVGIPLIDGMEATRRIREFAPADALPVVFISGYAHQQYRLAALASGGNDYLVKPIDFRELGTILGRYLKMREMTRSWLD